MFTLVGDYITLFEIYGTPFKTNNNLKSQIVRQRLPFLLPTVWTGL